jgi:general secretion pathway protein C
MFHALNDNAPMAKLWTVKITTFTLWALAAGSAVFWFLHVPSPASGANAAVAAMSVAQTASTDVTAQVAKALGAKDAAPVAVLASDAAKRFQLQGVVAVGSSRGAALISVDGKPAKPYRVGSSVEDGLQVTSVAARSASLGSNGAAAFTLELPLKK